MTTKTLQSGRHIFRSRQAGTISISVGMLESIHMFRKLNKWLLLTSALLLCLVRPLIMWLSPSCLLVVYALGRTHIDVSLSCLYSVPLCTHTVVLTLMSFSCLYGVPLVYARGRTHIDRALAWLRGVPFIFSTLIFVVLFVWCTVVYAHGRTYIDVSFSCLYGVPLVYARGRTHIDRTLAWLRGVPFMFSTLIFVVLFVWCTVVYAHGRTYIDVSFSCLYGVPLVYARGRTHIDRALEWFRGVPFMFSTLILCGLVCMVYRCVRTRSYLHWRVLLLFVWCTVSVRTRSYSHG